MKDELISFETAKLAKELGFNEYCIDTFDAKGVEQDRYNLVIPADTADDDLREMFENTNSMLIAIGESLGNEPYVSRPSQSLLQRWLREVHGMYVVLDMTSYSNDWRWQLCRRDKQPIYSQVLDQTYEEALEGGLIAGLTYLS